MAKTHRVPAGTMSAAFAAATNEARAEGSLFEYDLFNGYDVPGAAPEDKPVHKPGVLDIKSEQFKVRILSRWSFACDAWINNVLSSALRDYRMSKEESDEAYPWDSYQEFLDYAQGIATTENAMEVMGLEVKPLSALVNSIYAVRRQIQSEIANIVGLTYEEPSIDEFFLNPSARKDDLNTTLKREANARAYATDEDGVIHIDRYEQHLASNKAKAKVARKQQLEWDRKRGVLSSLLFKQLLITDAGPDSEDPFGDLSIELKHKMLTGVRKYITGLLAEAEEDYKVTVEEHSNWVLESRPVLKEIRLALEHPIFDSIELN